MLPKRCDSMAFVRRNAETQAPPHPASTLRQELSSWLANYSVPRARKYPPVRQEFL